MKKPARQTILFSVTGMSPSVLTETVWALAHEKPAVIPDRIIIVTTTTGRDQLIEALFGPDKIWESLRNSLDAGARLHFGTTSHDIRVFTAQDPGTGLSRELDDLRTAADNRTAADFVLEQLRALTENPDTRIIASLAGGRKTMTALLVSCMTLIGRETDRLTHVLVNQPFDGPNLKPRFFFPAQAARTLTFSGTSITTAEAVIELADVPFVPLRNRFKELGDFPGNFNELVLRYSRALKQDANRKVNVKLAADFSAVTVNGIRAGLRARSGLVLGFLMELNETGALPHGQMEAINPFKAYLARQTCPVAKNWNVTDQDDIKRELSEIRTILKAKEIAWGPGFRTTSLKLPPFNRV